MTKVQNIGVTLSILLFTVLFGFHPTEPALACSTGSGGFEHGSSISGGSVTVCVGTNESSPGSSSRTTTTTTTTVVKKEKVSSKKPAPKKSASKKTTAKPTKPIAKSKPRKVEQSCPSKSQLAAMPKNADAAERWVQNTCNSKPKPVAKQPPKKKSKKKTFTSISTTTTTVSTPRRTSSKSDFVTFTPQPLRATYKPERVLRVGETAFFTSFPSVHIRNQLVLGKRAEVQFTPVGVSWSFSDGYFASGTEVQRSFSSEGAFSAFATVSYSVRYRILGESNWDKVAGSMQIPSSRLQITVAKDSVPEEGSASAVLLVGEPCQPGSKAFGCQD